MIENFSIESVKEDYLTLGHNKEKILIKNTLKNININKKQEK